MLVRGSLLICAARMPSGSPNCSLMVLQACVDLILVRPQLELDQPRSALLEAVTTFLVRPTLKTRVFA